MNALEENRFTSAWQSIGRMIPKPRAVLCISAHWYLNSTAVTATAKPETIHDFQGFPHFLNDFTYAAPGGDQGFGPGGRRESLGGGARFR